MRTGSISRATVQRRARVRVVLLGLAVGIGGVASGQPADANYDEAKVPAYTLPDPLIDNAGRPVTTAAQWHAYRRSEILWMFETHMYGRSPGNPFKPVYTVEETDGALGGKAKRKQVRILFSEDHPDLYVDVLIYLPADAEGPAPMFLGLNFQGNHTVHSDPAIRITEAWARPQRDESVEDNRSNEKGRGVAASRWPIEMILERGYGVATAYYGEIDPDYDDKFRNGVHSLFAEGGSRKADEWGSISAWAWGLSRIMDYLQSDGEIDGRRVALMGHSRLGKTALWAGATDPRFALVISNNSGCGGAALSRRAFGETVRRINDQFPHWFCGYFKSYSGNEGSLPIDQHELIALIAPRPVLVSSAEQDLWADPRGEFLAALHASPVYELFGEKGLSGAEFPGATADSLIGNRIAYKHRPGEHDVTADDWKAYMDFADRELARP